MKTNIPTRLLPLGAGRATPLPYDSLVEYVQTSSASSYVDIGTITTSSSLRMEIDIMANSPSTDEKMFGSAEALGIGCYNNSWRVWTSNSLYAVGASTTITYPRIRVVVSNGTARILSGTATLATRSVPSGVTRPFYAFALGRVGGSITRGRARIYSIAIDDGSLVRDLAPCRVGTAGALYDRVSGAVFRSATSTALIPGPDLT